MTPRRLVPLLLLSGCAPAEEGWSERDRARIAALSPIPAPPPRPTNRLADDPDAAAVGARLFHDPLLSVDGATSCATCHVAERSFTDGRPVAVAVGTGRRNTPTIETVAWQTWFFWDGRADSGWAQATGPIVNPIEMASTPERVLARVREGYAEDWARLFGGVPEDPALALAQVGKVLEAFERTISPGPSRFDRWAEAFERGEESDLLTVEEQRGLKLFVGEADCVSCHNGPLFTDHSFHTLGIPTQAKGGVDVGRAVGAPEVLEDPYNCRGAYSDDPTACDELRFLDPAFPDWPAAFKTPTLRNVSRTAPYMHDGSMATLTAVLQFYNELPGQPLVGHRELTLRPLKLSAEDLAALEAFLHTLDGEPVTRTAPPAP